jgi:ankyrin repeat protein
MAPEDTIRKAMCDDDPTLLRQTLANHPELQARINEPLGPFDSPLINSSRSRAMLAALLDAGADINARSKWWAGSFGILDLASDDLAAYAIDRGARLDAHSAARLGRIGDLRQMLLVNPALVHARGGDGKMPLHFARTVEIAKLLLENGADINARDVDHESTPAQYLIQEHPSVVRFLVDRGCEADIFIAAALGDTAFAKRLLDRDPNCIRMRVNAEHFPMKNPHAGGTIYQWTLGFNVSPHEVAKKFGHVETYALLLERTPPEVKLLVYCWAGEEQQARALLAADQSITARLQPSDTRQLADAARNDNFAAVRLMVLAGLPLSVRGQHHATPLHWAAWHGNAEMTKLLLSRPGAPLEDADNDYHCTPLAWAIHGSENGWHREKGNYPTVVQALLEAGAKIPDRTDGSPEVRRLLQSSRNR